VTFNHVGLLMTNTTVGMIVKDFTACSAEDCGYCGYCDSAGCREAGWKLTSVGDGDVARAAAGGTDVHGHLAFDRNVQGLEVHSDDALPLQRMPPYLLANLRREPREWLEARPRFSSSEHKVVDFQMGLGGHIRSTLLRVSEHGCCYANRTIQHWHFATRIITPQRASTRRMIRWRVGSR
jgi:hypothetical protein